MTLELTEDELRWLTQIVEAGVRAGVAQDGLPAYMVGANVVRKLALAASEKPSDSPAAPASS